MLLSSKVERDVYGGDHAAIQDKFPGYLAGSLDDMDWLRVRTHLAGCPPCCDELAKPGLPQPILADVDRIDPPTKALPMTVEPREPSPAAPTDRPGWLVVLGAASVAALVAFGLGYAMAIGGV